MKQDIFVEIGAEIQVVVPDQAAGILVETEGVEVEVFPIGLPGIPGLSGPKGDTGPAGDGSDIPNLTLIFENHLI